jgi:Protein of unknown function (DUF2905)
LRLDFGHGFSPRRRLKQTDEDAGILPPAGSEFKTMRALLIALGLLLVAAGLAWPVLSRYLGKLPGDLVVRKPGFTFFFPLATCLLISLLLTLLFSLFRK